VVVISSRRVDGISLISGVGLRMLFLEAHVGSKDHFTVFKTEEGNAYRAAEQRNLQKSQSDACPCEI